MEFIVLVLISLFLLSKLRGLLKIFFFLAAAGLVISLLQAGSDLFSVF